MTGRAATLPGPRSRVPASRTAVPRRPAAFSVPLQLLTCFELAYVVRKKRSSNFFCMTFDQGHRKKEGNCSSGIRYSVWVAAFLLVFVSTIGNAQYILAPSAAAFTGTARFSVKSLTPDRFGDGFTLSDFVDVVPEALGMVFTLYIGASLWRYGSVHSMDVSASIINRWAGVALSAAGLVASWCAQPASWPAPYAYNGCAVALGVSLCVTARLIDHNLRQLDLLNRSLQRDSEAPSQPEPEVVPPRFRAASKEMVRSPSDRGPRPGTPAANKPPLRASRSMSHFDPRHSAKAAAAAAAPAPPPRATAPLRPLPPGPRPPDSFQGVNPMMGTRSGGAMV